MTESDLLDDEPRAFSEVAPTVQHGLDGLMECPKCNGWGDDLGLFPGDTCTRCKGTGFVELSE